MLHARHANPSGPRLPGIRFPAPAREATVTVTAMTAVAWWGIGGWAAVPLLIVLSLLVTVSVAFGVQVGIGLARRGVRELPGVPGGEACVSAAGELLACLGARL